MIDTHAHITDDLLFPQIEEILARAKAAQVEQIVCICTNRSTLERGLEVQKRHPQVFLAAATTPHDVQEEGELNFELFAEAARQNKLCAIGETGLDYHYEHSPKELQRTFLHRYLALAKECNLPILFHCRDAFEELFEIVQSYALPKRLLHCFTGTRDEALRAVHLGYMISLSGILTFHKSFELQATIKEIPLENLVIETDSPYLAPQGFRGKINEPAHVVEVAKTLAHLKSLPLEEITSILTHNSKTFFNI